MNEICVAAGVASGKRLTATKMRHRASTLFALQDVTESECSAFYKHMGHGKDINTSVYQYPLRINEICKVGK